MELQIGSCMKYSVFRQRLRISISLLFLILKEIEQNAATLCSVGRLFGFLGACLCLRQGTTGYALRCCAVTTVTQYLISSRSNRFARLFLVRHLSFFTSNL